MSLLLDYCRDDASPSVCLPRKVLLGGEAIDTARWQQLRQLAETTVYNMYGPTEATIDCALCDITGLAAPTMGRPIANARIHILDEDLRLVPAGVAGELFISGSGLARGYFNRPGLTAEKFIPDPYSAEPGARMYRSGDLARYLADGTIEYLGRIDNQVKVRGFRIELGEIEAALRAQPGVRAAVVLAYERSAGDRRLIGYYVPEGPGITAASLRSGVARHLPDHMVPSGFVELSALPLTRNGKVDRAALPAPELDAADRIYVAPRDDTEASVATLLAEVLKQERVGVLDNFFALGGHSLHLMQVMAKSHAMFGVELPLRTLYETPTVEALAQVVRSEREKIRQAEIHSREAFMKRVRGSLDELSEEELRELIANKKQKLGKN